MKRQQYRSGIPAGIGGNGTVADKVGFRDSYLHDAGIVYSGKGDYAFVIMTSGSFVDGDSQRQRRAVSAAVNGCRRRW